MFNKRLENFIDKCEILNESQYGFREKRSTTMAILEAVEEITKKMLTGRNLGLKYLLI